MEVGYAIDIAAKMSGGAQTYAELDRITESLSGAGKNATHFIDAISQVSDQLNVARDASAAANAALSEGEDEYRILERAAVQASKAVENAALAAAKAGEAYDKGFADNLAAEELEPLAKALVDAQRQLEEFTVVSKASDKALEDQATVLRGLESAVSGADAKEQGLVRTLGNLRRMNDHVNDSVKRGNLQTAKMQRALTLIGGPAGAAGSKALGAADAFEELTASVGKSGAVALVATAGVLLLVAAVAAVAVVAVAGAVAVAKWGVSMADSARNVGLASDALEALHPELVALRGTIASVADATGMHSDELQELAGKLREVKVAAADMPAALRAAAMAETALGSGGSADFIADIKAGKRAVSDLAFETERSLGGIVARQMLGLEAQSARLQKNLAATFGGLDIEQSLVGLSVLVGLFDKATVSGQAMQFLFESIFQPLIDQAENASYVVEAFVLGFEIGLVKLYMAIKPAIQAVAELFGFDNIQLADVLTLAKNAGEMLAPVFAALAIAFAAVAAVVGLVVIGFGVFVAAIVAVNVAMVQFWTVVVNAAGQVSSAIANMVAYVVGLFTGLPSAMGDAGRNMIAGFVRGILGSAGSVINAVKSVIGGSVATSQKVLDSHSPSKVMTGLGGDAGEGYAIGLEGMASTAQAAMSELVEPPESPLAQQDALGGNLGSVVTTAPAAQASAASASPGPANLIDLRGASLSFGGAGDAPTSIERFGEMLTRALEGDAAVLTGAEAV